MSKMILETPYGTRDFLPKSAAAKRAVEQKIQKTDLNSFNR